MSLTAFLFAADALRLEDRIDFVIGSAPGVTVPAASSPADTKQRNAEAMAALGPILAMTGQKRRR